MMKMKTGKQANKPFQPSKKLLEKYADVLVNFALNGGKGAKKGDTIHIFIWESAKPMLKALVKVITDAGCYPFITYLPDEAQRTGGMPYFLENADPKVLKKSMRPYLQGIVDQADHDLLMISIPNPAAMKNVPAENLALYNQGTRGIYFSDIRDKKQVAGKLSWTLALYGTEYMAKEAGMSLREYWNEMKKACFLDKKDPVSEWKKIYKELDRVRKKLTKLKIEKVHVVGKNTDLWVRIGEDRQWLAGSGQNVPTYEIFCSPDWRGTNGYISFNEPLYYSGTKIEGIRLEFQKGKVVKATAKKNQKALNSILKEKGGNMIGEYSLTDKRISRITRPMANTLYDENMGGPYGNTHLALGQAYSDGYIKGAKKLTPALKKKLGFNQSTTHVDMMQTVDRTVTAYMFDGTEKVIYKDGMFQL